MPPAPRRARRSARHSARKRVDVGLARRRAEADPQEAAGDHRRRRPSPPAPRFPSSCPTSRRCPPKPQSRRGRTGPAAKRSTRRAAKRRRWSAMRGLSSPMTTPPARLHALVEPGAQARRAGPCRRACAASAAAKASALPARPAFRGDSPSPARRPASSVARSRTSRAPIPGGPPSLCAASGDEIGVGQRQFARALRAIGEQQRTRVADPRREPVERLNDARFRY